nr:zinc finger, BED-type, phospholipase-like, homeodomain-like protein [Tanacetum cinerariifolium]
MSDNTTKAQCKHCFYFFSKSSNSTLRSHIIHPYCEALKTVPELTQSSMGQDESVFVYNLDYLREQFTGLVIQRGLPFNHFDHEKTTRVFQNTMQPIYNHVSRSTLKRHLDTQERKQHTSTLENALDFEYEVLDADVQENEVTPLSDEEIALDVSSQGTMASGSRGEEPDFDYDLTNYDD